MTPACRALVVSSGVVLSGGDCLAGKGVTPAVLWVGGFFIFMLLRGLTGDTGLWNETTLAGASLTSGSGPGGGGGLLGGALLDRDVLGLFVANETSKRRASAASSSTAERDGDLTAAAVTAAADGFGEVGDN